MKYLEFVKSLFVDYSDELRHFVTRVTGNSADAEEIVQDAFHNFLSTKNAQEIENPRAYLYKTANHLALNRMRKNKYHDNYINTLNFEDGTISLERQIIAEHDVEFLAQKINKLPERSRTIFLMNRLEAKTYLEISEELGISISSVEKHMMKALRFIRKYLDD